MNGYQYPYSNQLSGGNPLSQLQQMFPQPQGSVYSINSPIELGNVPIGSTGLSIALCLQENLMYIKSFQNSNPVIMAYKILPFTRDGVDKNSTGSQNSETNAKQDNKKESISIENLAKQLNRIEEYLSKQSKNQSQNSGGEFDELL